MIRGVHRGNTYKDQALSYSEKGNLGFYVKILDVIEAQFRYMTSRHGKVFFVMFGLNYPAGSCSNYPDNNELLSRFLEALKLHCSRKSLDPHYLWVREKSTTGQIHYHCILLLDGNKIQNAYGILEKATALWTMSLGVEDGRGLVHSNFSSNHSAESFYYTPYRGVKIVRADPQFEEVYGRCFQVASYLAKRYSKGEAPPYVNEFGCSRIPR